MLGHTPSSYERKSWQVSVVLLYLSYQQWYIMTFITSSFAKVNFN